jgi:hypothetical protein
MLELMILVQSICFGFIAGSWEQEFQRGPLLGRLGNRSSVKTRPKSLMFSLREKNPVEGMR